MRHPARVVGAAITAAGAFAIALLAKRDIPWLQAVSHPLTESLLISTTQRENWLSSLYAVSPTAHDPQEFAVQDHDGTVDVIVPRFDRPERFDVEVAVSWNEHGQPGDCELIFTVSREMRYAFMVTSDGQAALGAIKPDANDHPQFQMLTKPIPVRANSQQGMDRLIVQVRGQQLSFVVNERQVAQIVDTMMLDTWVLAAFIEGHRNVRLDHFIKRYEVPRPGSQ